MERLKALLYCLRCHLVLLIFVGLAAGGYWLRDDLYRQFGVALGPASERAAEAASGEPASRTESSLPVNPKLAAVDRRHPPAAAEVRPAANRQAPAPTERELVDAADFSFRPLDAPESGALAGLPSHRELLTEARRAYWNGDIRLALRAYQRLIEAHPDHPDYPGELGNIYYEQGARQLAASFYLDSARLLLERGERSRAEALVPILDRLHADSAAELRGRLAGAGLTSYGPGELSE